MKQYFFPHLKIGKWEVMGVVTGVCSTLICQLQAEKPGLSIDISSNYCRVGILPAFERIFAAMSNISPIF
jgi:hypothetical protein